MSDEIDDTEAASDFLCPTCGNAMTPGEIGIGGNAGFSISWRDVHGGEAGTPGTLFTTDGKGALVRPGLVCRPCSSVFIDFQAEGAPATSSAPRTFEERVRNMDGAIDLQALVTVLREGDPRACTKAIEAFVEIGEPAIPLLEELSTDDDPDVRVDASKALERIRQE